MYKDLKLSERQLRKAIAADKEKLESIEREIDSIARGREEFHEEQTTIDQEIEEIKGSIESVGGSILTLFRSPPRVAQLFHDRLSALGGTLERKKLPRSMSREFFYQLARSSSCVCGRSISDHERDTILDHMDEYLAQDEIAVVNQMKSGLKSVSSDGHSFTSRIEHLRAKRAELRAAEQRSERLRERMKEEGVDRVHELDRRCEVIKRQQIQRETTLGASRRTMVIVERIGVTICPLVIVNVVNEGSVFRRLRERTNFAVERPSLHGLSGLHKPVR